LRDVLRGAVAPPAALVGEQAPVNATLTALVKAVERQWTAPQN
jgi:2-dehydropantoate 2-reductase